MFADYSFDFWLGYILGLLFLASIVFIMLRWIVRRHNRVMETYFKECQDHIQQSMSQLAQTIQNGSVKVSDDRESKTEALAVRFDLDPKVDPEAITKNLLEFLTQLSDYDIRFGGKGLSLDKSRSRSESGAFTFVLIANQPDGANERFQRIAQELNLVLSSESVDETEKESFSDLFDQVVSDYEDRTQTRSIPDSSLTNHVRNGLPTKQIHLTRLFVGINQKPFGIGSER
jgi:hypothetical protein